MRQALFLIHNVATDTGYHSVTNGNTSPTVVNGDSGIVLGGSGQSANKAIKDFEVFIICIGLVTVYVYKFLGISKCVSLATLSNILRYYVLTFVRHQIYRLT